MPHQVKSDALAGGAGLRGLSGIKMKEEDDVSARRPAKKLTEAEKWEARQLIASGVLDVSEYPTFEDEDDFASDAKLVGICTIYINNNAPAYLNSVLICQSNRCSPSSQQVLGVRERSFSRMIKKKSLKLTSTKMSHLS